jgi:hypothetical protein
MLLVACIGIGTGVLLVLFPLELLLCGIPLLLAGDLFQPVEFLSVELV